MSTKQWCIAKISTEKPPEVARRLGHFGASLAILRIIAELKEDTVRILEDSLPLKKDGVNITCENALLIPFGKIEQVDREIIRQAVEELKIDEVLKVIQMPGNKKIDGGV